jgi:hypothetical protein
MRKTPLSCGFCSFRAFRVKPLILPFEYQETLIAVENAILPSLYFVLEV